MKWNNTNASSTSRMNEWFENKYIFRNAFISEYFQFNHTSSLLLHSHGSTHSPVTTTQPV